MKPLFAEQYNVSPAKTHGLAVGLGVGSQLRQPLGISIIGGLLVSQVLTLFTTPVVYLALDRLRSRRSFEQPASRTRTNAGAAGDIPAE